MHAQLLHIYGPLNINSFGLLIIIGIVLFSILMLKDKKIRRIMPQDTYFNLLSLSIVIGILGGRLLYVLTSWPLDSWGEIFAVWNGGFSLLGGIIALLIFIPYYVKKQNISAIAFLDRIAIYAPLLQAISRLGCYFAGCCFGIPTTLPWAIKSEYCDFAVHPTQLYSAAILFIIFLCTYFFLDRLCKKPGQLLCMYIFLVSIERFIIDFWRGDRTFFANPHLQIFSILQLLALLLVISSLILLIIITHKKKTNESF